MKCYVVCEGLADQLLLEGILKDEFLTDGTEVVVVRGGGWSGAESMARSILAVRQAPVALVVDADSSDPQLTREREAFLNASLGEFRSRFQVFVVVPEIEVLLFKSPELLERAGLELSERDLLRAQYEPKRVLNELADGQPLDLVQRLVDAGAGELLAGVDPIPSLRAFIRATVRTAAAA